MLIYVLSICDRTVLSPLNQGVKIRYATEKALRICLRRDFSP
jgi:hypothetical protein